MYVITSTVYTERTCLHISQTATHGSCEPSPAESGARSWYTSSPKLGKETLELLGKMYIKQVIICKLLVIICKLFGKMSVKKHHLNSSGFSLPTTKTGHLNLGVYPNSKQTKSQQRPVIASRSGRRAGLFPSVFHLNCERAGSALGWVIAMAKSHQNPMCLPMSCRL